jgi:hypothetical protein
MKRVGTLRQAQRERFWRQEAFMSLLRIGK